MTGSSSKIVYRPLPIDDPQQRKPDVTMAERRLGWTPTVALTEGLKATIAYFEHQLAPPAKELAVVA
ncbi:hypothetical protein [Shinella sp. HZN7]|uniref:hypothetical protein n=1 Tax=Shinella sp. (strain HZN7) TaxID=879274 RepID=UPI000A8033A4|nr:hypothetical protein [Shinella sp. HZN7]